MHGTTTRAGGSNRSDSYTPRGLGQRWPDPWSSVLHVREYQPYRLPDGTRNPSFRDEDGRVLDLKSNLDSAVVESAREFARVLRPMLLPARTVLAVVPGHEASPSNRARALGRVVAHLAAEIGSRFVDGGDVLVRHRSVEKLATGGERALDIHLRSIRVARPELITGRSVIVLDDVTTTGNSLKACLSLLREAGASRVGALALARTAA